MQCELYGDLLALQAAWGCIGVLVSPRMALPGLHRSIVANCRHACASARVAPASAPYAGASLPCVAVTDARSCDASFHRRYPTVKAGFEDQITSYLADVQANRTGVVHPSRRVALVG